MGEAASDGYWQSTDGLRLHCRLYGARTAMASVLYLPGLALDEPGARAAIDALFACAA